MKVAKKSARLRLLERLQAKALKGGQLPPSRTAPRATIKPSLARPINRLGTIRKAEQERARQALIAQLAGTAKTTKLQTLKNIAGKFVSEAARVHKPISDFFGAVFKKLKKAAAFLTGERTAAHKALGKAPKRPPPRGQALGLGISSVRSTPHTHQPMTAVASSNVASVGWEAEETNSQTGTLFILFRNGWLYQYVNCPKWLYEGLLISGSKGRYVWQYIRRGLYPDGQPYGHAGIEGYERIDPAGHPFGYTGKRRQIAVLRGYRRK